MHDTNEKNAKTNRQYFSRRGCSSTKHSHLIGVLLFACTLAPQTLNAEATQPEPMTMAFAESRVDAHPGIMASMADIQLAKARQLQADSRNDIDISLNGRLQWIGPSELASNRSHDDHKISLNARKILYDFGRGLTRRTVARESVLSTEMQLEYQRGLKVLDIKRRYLDVLLSDLDFAAENEAISIAFIRTNRLEQRADFGEVSELDLLEAQAAYQLSLAKRNAAELRQRSSRAMFAEVIGLPNQLSENFEKPNLNDITADLPDVKPLLQSAMENQAGVKSLKLKLEALQTKLTGLKLSHYPTLTGFGEIADYSRTEGGSDEWRLGVALAVPLYQGGRTAAASAEVKAKSASVQAMLSELRADIRQEVLTRWQNISLLKLRLNQADLEIDSRDLYLDKARALYQMNVRSDLGDAMTRFSRARYNQAKVAFDLLLAREKLKLLTGHDLRVKTTLVH